MVGQYRGTGVQPVANVVAVENESANALLEQLMIDKIRKRALARGAEPGKPNHATVVPVEAFVLLARDRVGVPGNVRLFDQCVVP